ncbi:hypothetical protein Acr_00g0073390 [Actinidia rufa]|uniref:Secreted protein n=1 Tax=Actinidia rufa TaxID=165716 RepID=A0A7J0DS46_9ERIC|nr:hypothetical protein Acr_00g0073390 [Actinidia rufa]
MALIFSAMALIFSAMAHVFSAMAHVFSAMVSQGTQLPSKHCRALPRRHCCAGWFAVGMHCCRGACRLEIGKALLSMFAGSKQALLRMLAGNKAGIAELVGRQWAGHCCMRLGCTLGCPGGAAFCFWLVVGHSLQEKAWTMAMGSQVQHWLSCACTGLDNASRTAMGSPNAHPVALMLRLTMANWDALSWSSKGACWHVQVCKWVCQMWPMSSPC